MARLPQPGGDSNNWGGILNDFLSVEHNPDGTLKTTGSLRGKEAAIAAGTLSQYWRGDKTWQNLDTDSALSANSDIAIASQKAVKTYIDTQLSVAAVPDATATMKGKVQLAGDFGGTAAVPTVKNFPRVYNVLDGVTINGTVYRAAGDGTTDDTPALQQIMQYASDNGGGIMWFPAATYLCQSSIWIRSYVTVDGVPGKSILTSTTEALYGILRSDQTTPVYDFTVRNVKFLGNVTEEPSVPQGSRTRNPSPFHAIKINGSFAPNTTDDFGQPTSGPVIQNVVIENVTVQNMASLPITIWGVTGRCVTRGCEFRNNKDAGWVYNEEVICIGNHSINSADNGFSLSRGNRKLVCVGNTVESAALYGIWLAGYNADIGPTEFTCTGNTIINTGRSAITLENGTSNAVVSGNYIYQGYNRGPLGGPSDTGIDGITISGAGGGVHATNLLISDNVIISAARNGITVKECNNTTIQNNLIISPGTQFKADGMTAIAAGDTTSNNGICTITTGTYTNLIIKNNYCIENRLTPYGNWPVYKANTSGTKAVDNKWSGSWRNNVNSLDIVDSAISGLPVQLNVNGGSGTDGGDTSVDLQLNMQGAGKTHIRNADGSGLNIENTSTSSSASATLLLSAGSLTSYIGAMTATRQDAASSSILAFRVLRNSLLSSAASGAPFWIKGLPTNSRAVLGLMGGQVIQRTAVADTNYIALPIDYIVAYTSLTAPRTITLKDATTLDAGQAYIIKDETGTAGTNAITISPSAGQTIDGATTKSINVNYGQVMLYSDGTNWWTGSGIYNTSQILPMGTAGGDLSGTYPNPTLVATGTAGTYAYPASLTTDSKGRVTSVTASTTTGSGSSVLQTSPTITTPNIAQINDGNGNAIITTTGITNAVNHLNITNAATGNGVVIGPAGVDSNIPLIVTSKNTESILVRPGSNSVMGLKIQNATGLNTIADFDSVNLRMGIRNVAPTSTLHISGSIGFARTAVSDAAYSLLEADCILEYTSLTAARTVTLPSATGITGRMYIIKDGVGAAATFPITVATSASQTIDGSSTKLLNVNYGIVKVYSNGSNWLTM